jgi:hypothetical protein
MQASKKIPVVEAPFRRIVLQYNMYLPNHKQSNTYKYMQAPPRVTQSFLSWRFCVTQILGRAMAQVVGRRPLNAEARIRSRVNPYGICGG